MSLVEVFALLALAILEGSLVALPRALALAPLARLQSPAWAATLPGFILTGTLVPLWHPGFASAIAVLSAVATPLMAVLAAATVARGRRPLLLATITIALGVTLILGVEGWLPASIVTAFGCMAVGVALVRLIPRPWLVAAVVATACLDAALLAMHVGQPAAALMAHATAHLHGRAFDGAIVGPVTVDYPDLVLAGALGGFVAGKPLQGRAALSVTVLAAASAMLLAVIRIVPETVPIALIFVLVASAKNPPFRRRSSPLFAAALARWPRSAGPRRSKVCAIES